MTWESAVQTCRLGIAAAVPYPEASVQLHHAAVAVSLLRDRTWTGQDTVDLLGGEDLSRDDMARTLTEVLGAPIRAQAAAPDAVKGTLLGYGFSEAVAQAMVDMAAAKERGLDHSVQRTSENTTSTGFRAFAEEELHPAI
jgi:uncharacterized protein YbjT (DUF2867 family)